MKKNIVFLGSKKIGMVCLKYLNENKLNLNVSLLGVFTKESDPYLNDYCKKNNIPIFYELNKILKLENIDLIVSVQYHKILKKIHIDKAKQIAINLHMAPLPRYRGCNQFSFALINEDQSFGTTLHVLDEGIDTGGIIAMKKFPILKNYWVKDLYEKTVQESIILFKENIKKIIDNEFVTISQQEIMEEEVFYYSRKDIEFIKNIDLSWSKEKILKHIKATSMPGFEPPFFLIDNKKFFIVSEEEMKK